MGGSTPPRASWPTGSACSRTTPTSGSCWATILPSPPGGPADDFDISAERGREKSLTFGAGPHFCMGANLARAELQEGLGFLAAHLRELSLDGEPEYGTITGLYGLESLPIGFAPAT